MTSIHIHGTKENITRFGYYTTKYDFINSQQQTKFFSHDIDSLIVEAIKEQMSKRTMYENKNLLKLLQITCGIPEIRALSISKLEPWLANPKVNF